MLPKQQRLKTKDVLFLTRKRNYFGSGFFGFFYIQQYPNIRHHQISFHVSIKYNKHSTARNILKRSVIQEASTHISDSIGQKYYKIFVVMNKDKIPLLQKEFENLKKKDIILHMRSHFAQSFTALSRYLGKFSATSSNVAQKS